MLDLDESAYPFFLVSSGPKTELMCAMYLSSGPRSLYEPEYVSWAKAASSRCPAQYISCDQLRIRHTSPKENTSVISRNTYASLIFSYAMFFHFSSGSTTYITVTVTFHEPSTLPELDSRKYTYGKVCIDVPVVLLCASYVVDGFFDELAQRRVGCDFESIARRFEPFRYVRIPRKWGEMPVW